MLRSTVRPVAFHVEEADGERELGLVLGRLQPAELILPEQLANQDDVRDTLAAVFAGSEVPPIADLPAFAWDTAMTPDAYSANALGSAI